MNWEFEDSFQFIISLIVCLLLITALNGCCSLKKARLDALNALKLGYIEGYLEGYEQREVEWSIYEYESGNQEL